MTDRMTEAEMLSRAGRAVGKIDRHGRRGVTNVSFDEIEAMAATLACMGLPALPDGGEVEDPIFVSRRRPAGEFNTPSTPSEKEIKDV